MRSKQALVLVFCITFFYCSGIKNKSNDEDLPNIVLIIGDDHGYPYWGFMGSDYDCSQYGFSCK